MQVSKALRVSTSWNCSGAPSPSRQFWLEPTRSTCGSTVK
jgi:hypothetical protein